MWDKRNNTSNSFEEQKKADEDTCDCGRNHYNQSKYFTAVQSMPDLDLKSCYRYRCSIYNYFDEKINAITREERKRLFDFCREHEVISLENKLTVDEIAIIQKIRDEKAEIWIQMFREKGSAIDLDKYERSLQKPLCG